MKVFKRVALALGVIAAAFAAWVALIAARYEPVIRPNVQIGLVPVGGLTKLEAAKRLRIWWETERRNQITLENAKLSKQWPPGSVSSFGLTLDDEKSVAAVPMADFWETAQRSVGLGDAPLKELPIVYGFDPTRLKQLENFVEKNSGAFRPARVYLQGATLVRVPEKVGLALDSSKMQETVQNAMQGGEGELPLTEGKKRVTDEQLAQIQDAIGFFSTRFPTSDVARCTNIRLATQKINGTVLAPGDRFSFNQIVGPRSLKGGFRVAPVIKNGKHDFDIGGGICQVSTTLYNAVLFANLKIVNRSNHSLPSAYVPLGRDATVDYGTRDFIFANDQGSPVAIASRYEPGRITFTVLGVKDQGLQVKLDATDIKRWSRGTQTVNDPTLPAGQQKVVDKGGSAGTATLYRLVYRDGKLVRKELMNRSAYRGSPRIIAVGSARPKPSSPPPDDVLPPETEDGRDRPASLGENGRS